MGLARQAAKKLWGKDKRRGMKTEICAVNDGLQSMSHMRDGSFDVWMSLVLLNTYSAQFVRAGGAVDYFKPYFVGLFKKERNIPENGAPAIIRNIALAGSYESAGAGNSFVSK